MRSCLAATWHFAVACLTSADTPRASPKSQMHRSQLAFTRRLDGFKSRCRTLAEWMYFSPRKSWKRKYW